MRPTICVSILSGLVYAVSLSAATINVYSTGVDNAGQPLTGGAAESHYLLTANPLDGNSNPYVALGALSPQTTSSYSIPSGWPMSIPTGWVNTSNMDARWIAPEADVAGILGNGSDSLYVYQTTFSLAGLDPATAKVEGVMAADNYISEVLLNGVLVPNSTVQSTPDYYSFKNMTALSLTSGFQPGVNTLSFYVLNSKYANITGNPNPTGLLVDFTLATADVAAVPEPATLLLTGLGLAIAAGLARRRR